MVSTYESIAFLIGDDAKEALTIVQNEGESVALAHLKQWHEPGLGTLVSTRDDPWKDVDKLYEEDNWIMYYNQAGGYIGLVCRLDGVFGQP